ncbi:hypothetical protein HYS29_00755, partial [Candidatus Microgenomates bacterium]|nr:hypothetical protein [Candidatus Microgenomates bacterium]
SRSSWNPNPLPFFSLLAVLAIYQGVKSGRWWFFVFAGIMLGIALQLHYIALFLIISIGLYLLLIRLHLAQGVTLAKDYATTFIGFLIGFAPFLAFEATHSFPNTKTVANFALGGTGETGFTGGKFLDIVSNVFFRLFGRLVTRFPPPEQVSIGIHFDIAIWYWLTLFLAISSVVILFFQIKKRGSLLLATWLSVGIILFGFYKKPIYDYYFGFMYPLPFLLVGNFLSVLASARQKVGWVVALVLFFGLFLFNLDGLPFKTPPNRQYQQVKAISQFVLEKTGGESFNFALITGGNSDHAYRYFFELAGNPPITIKPTQADPKRETVTEQLLVICEDPRCQPLGHPLWEVAGFGRAEIAGEWQVSVVKVYKLTHYKK